AACLAFSLTPAYARRAVPAERRSPLPSARSRAKRGEHGQGRGRASRSDARVRAKPHGKTTFAGYVDEPAKVTINGKAAKVLSTDGGAPYKFEGIVELDA